MYLIIHYFMLRTLVYNRVKGIGIVDLPMPLDDIFKKTWYLPTTQTNKFFQIFILKQLGFISTYSHKYGDNTEKETMMIQLKPEGWKYYHEKKKSIYKFVFQCFWNILILLFGYYLGKN